MRSRRLRWKKLRPHVFVTLPVACAISLGLWIAYPGMASDFGIIPVPPAPGKLTPGKDHARPVHRRHRFPGPIFWRDGPPHLSDLQASAVQVLNNIKRGVPTLVADGGPVAKLQTVGMEVRIRLRREANYLRLKFHLDDWLVKDNYRNYVDNLRHHCDDPNNANTERCRKHVSTAPSPVPEPATWAMLLVGVAGLGGMLRGRRQAQRAAGEPSAARSANSSR